MFASLSRVLAACSLVLSLCAQGASPTKALFTAERARLEAFQKISDSEVLELKEAVLKALVAAGFKPIAKVPASRIAIGFDSYHGITAYSERGETEFSVLIRPSGEISVISLKAPTMQDAFKVFLNTQIFMAQNGLIRAQWNGSQHMFRNDKMNRILTDAILASAPVAIDPAAYSYYLTEVNGKGIAFFRHSDYHKDFSFSEEGNVLFGNDFNVAAERTVVDSLNADDASHVDRARVETLLAAKPVQLDKSPRISAMYDALAVIVADDRWNVRTVASERLGSAKGIDLTPKPAIDLANLRDIDYGVLYLTTTTGELKLDFAAGHFSIGVDLDKPRGWLYGEGEVGGQVGFYHQLKNPKAPAKRPETARVLVDWERVNRTGYVGELVKDPRFLALDLDLRGEKPRGTYITEDEMKELLALPIVSGRIKEFVRDAILGASNLEFSFGGRRHDSATELVISQLAKAGEGRLAQDFIDALWSQDEEIRREYERYYAAQRAKSP